jgi:hypothetical protein
MIEKVLLKRSIKKTSQGDFSTFMAQQDRKEVVKVLEYAAKKANEDQKRLVDSE